MPKSLAASLLAGCWIDVRVFLNGLKMLSLRSAIRPWMRRPWGGLLVWMRGCQLKLVDINWIAGVDPACRLLSMA